MAAAIYITLHGETVWNLERRFQGHLDSPLTLRGVNQARLMGENLKRLFVDAIDCPIVSSPLGRAWSTAKIICEVLGISPRRIESDSRLAEIDLGSWSGLTREEIEARWPDALNGSSRYDWYFRSPDGETLEAATNRLSAWLKDANIRNQVVVAVTHGVASRVLRGLYLQIAKEAELSLEVTRVAVFRLANGSIERLPCVENSVAGT